MVEYARRARTPANDHHAPIRKKRNWGESVFRPRKSPTAASVGRPFIVERAANHARRVSAYFLLRSTTRASWRSSTTSPGYIFTAASKAPRAIGRLAARARISSWTPRSFTTLKPSSSSINAASYDVYWRVSNRQSRNFWYKMVHGPCRGEAKACPQARCRGAAGGGDEQSGRREREMLLPQVAFAWGLVVGTITVAAAVWVLSRQQH
jgi:hypothetical protein